MSKTVRKTIEAAASIPNLHAAFILMKVPAEMNVECRLYGGRTETVNLNLSNNALKALGFESAYATDIGLQNEGGEIRFVYDHANEKIVRTLGQILPHLSYIGKHGDAVKARLDKGYTLHPFIDEQTETYGVFLEEPETVSVQALGVAWDEGTDQGGGAW